MTVKNIAIDDRNLESVRDHIAGEFAMKSWWPTEGPLQAREEFEQAQHNPAALAEWCAKWLDGSQKRKLRLAVEKSGSSPTDQA